MREAIMQESLVGQSFLLFSILFSLVVFNIPKVDRTTSARVYLLLPGSAFFLGIARAFGERQTLFLNTPLSDLQLLVISANFTFALFGVVRYFAKRRAGRSGPQ